MKVLLVTSQITYMPQNYAPLIEDLLAMTGGHVAGLVLLKNLDLKVLKSTLGLSYFGATNVAKTLVKNAFSLINDRRLEICGEHNVPVYKIKTMNDPGMVSWVKNNQIDAIFNLRTRCIYKKAILEAPRLGCFNIHHGILPKYRGTLCDLYALSEGRPAGFAIHRMNKNLDAGQILFKQEVSSGDLNYLDYLAKTAPKEAQALAKIIRHMAIYDEAPEGEKNICLDPVMTRNPTKQKIKELKSQGMIL